MTVRPARSSRPIHTGRAARNSGLLAAAVAATLAVGLSGCASSSSTSHASNSTSPSSAVSAPSVASPSASATSPSAGAAVPPATAQRAGLHWVNNGGHKLAFYVTPGTLPAIVLDAGGGNDHTYWSKIVPQLSARTGAEVVTYDRSGMGMSPAVDGAFSDKQAASDLHAGLSRLGIAKQTVLVAHSEAGEIAVNLVVADPGDVRGAVLIDASLPEFYTPGETARIVAADAPAVAALKKKSPLTAAERQLVAVAANYGPEHTAYHALTWPADVPATVIASATTPFPAGQDAQAWRAAQASFAAAAPNRHLVTAAKSSHDVPLDRADVVVSQVTSLWNSTR